MLKKTAKKTAKPAVKIAAKKIARPKAKARPILTKRMVKKKVKTAASRPAPKISLKELNAPVSPKKELMLVEEKPPIIPEPPKAEAKQSTNPFAWPSTPQEKSGFNEMTAGDITASDKSTPTQNPAGQTTPSTQTEAPKEKKPWWKFW